MRTCTNGRRIASRVRKTFCYRKRSNIKGPYMHSASKRSGAGFQMRTVVIMPILWLCRVCKSKGHGNKRSKGKGKWAPGGWRPHIIDRGSGLREPSDSDPDSGTSPRTPHAPPKWELPPLSLTSQFEPLEPLRIVYCLKFPCSRQRSH